MTVLRPTRRGSDPGAVATALDTYLRQVKNSSPYSYTNDPNRVGNKQSLPEVTAPTGAMATDADVLRAYQEYMGYSNQADSDQAALARALANNIESSRKQRALALLQGHERLSGRGLLNSGVALNQDTLTNTAFDTTDFNLNDAYNNNLSAIAKKKLDLLQGYQNSQVVASAKQAKAQADAAAATLAAQQAAAQAQQQQADLMAQIQGLPTQDVPAAPTPTYLPPSMYKAPTPIKPKAPVRPVATPRAITNSASLSNASSAKPKPVLRPLRGAY